MSDFDEGIFVDIPRINREIGCSQGEKASTDVESSVKYPGKSFLGISGWYHIAHVVAGRSGWWRFRDATQSFTQRIMPGRIIV